MRRFAITAMVAYATVLLACVCSLGAQCTPTPVIPDGGTGGAPGAGGSPGIGGSVVVTCDEPTGGFCCSVYRVLAAHGCEEALPTADGQSFESRCIAAQSGPAYLRTPDVTVCTTTACVRQQIACSRGK